MENQSTQILIVEDEVLIATMIEKNLVSVGYTVVQAVTSGEAAVKAAAEHNPDIILMDIRLRGTMDGIDAAKRITAAARIPIIFVTAYIDDDILEQAKSISPYGYLVKPIQKGPLKAAVEIALNMAHMEMERAAVEQERNNLQRMLQQTQKMEALGTLAGGIAHDFNNVLQPIIGLSKLGMQMVSDPEKNREYFSAIHKAAKRAREMVQQILTFSRQNERELKSIQLQPVIKEALKMLEHSLPSQVQIDADINPDCGYVRADLTQIHQVVINLATNAYHAMQNGNGRIFISLQPSRVNPGSDLADKVVPGSYVRLVIRDTGSGMPPEILEKIFDPYFTTKEINKGTGLGLSVVMGIVQGHRGAIDVVSAPGKGTEFSVYLPLAETDETIAVKPERQSTKRGSETILVVDDDPDIVFFQRELLTRLGYQVIGKTSSLEALTVFKENPQDCDLVLTDMTMPDLNGFQLSLLMLEAQPDLPIILCTGYNETINEEKARSIGIKGFMLKPMDQDELLDKIRTLLDR